MWSLSNTPPLREKTDQRETEYQRYIPEEIVEKILPNLPVKSLLRFSSVSKLWNSMVSQPAFVKRYHRRERMFVDRMFCRRLSDLISDDNIPIKDGIDLNGPFFGMRIRAFCDELACLEKGYSLFLSNPSTRTLRELPPWPQSEFRSISCCGLGYDSVGDDYKLVTTRGQIYSLRSNSWKQIQPFPHIGQGQYVTDKCWFVSGALHWLVCRGSRAHTIISFDLSTEKYGEVRLPNNNKYLSTAHRVRLEVAMGKLCVCLTYFMSLQLWMMEDYGDVESWTNKFYVNGKAIIPRFSGQIIYWKLVYFCDNEEERVVILRTDFNRETDGIYVYKFDHNTLVLNKFLCSTMFSEDGRVYVESLVSLAPTPTPTSED